MDRETTGSELEAKPTYSVIAYPAHHLPKHYTNKILANWLISYKHCNDYMKLIDRDAYFESYKVILQNIMRRPFSIIRLAVLSLDYDVVLGWSCIEAATLHYVYVNKDMRKKGIAKHLVPKFKEIEILTHLTKAGLAIWNNKMPNAIFDPFQV